MYQQQGMCIHCVVLIFWKKSNGAMAKAFCRIFEKIYDCARIRSSGWSRTEKLSLTYWIVLFASWRLSLRIMPASKYKTQPVVPTQLRDKMTLGSWIKYVTCSHESSVSEKISKAFCTEGNIHNAITVAINIVSSFFVSTLIKRAHTKIFF